MFQKSSIVVLLCSFLVFGALMFAHHATAHWDHHPKWSDRRGHGFPTFHSREVPIPLFKEGVLFRDDVVETINTIFDSLDQDGDGFIKEEEFPYTLRCAKKFCVFYENSP